MLSIRTLQGLCAALMCLGALGLSTPPGFTSPSPASLDAVGPNVAHPDTGATTANPKLFKAIDAWLKAYYKAGYRMYYTKKVADAERKAAMSGGGRGGPRQFGYREDRDVGDKSFAKRYGVLPKGVLGALTWRRDLGLMLDQAVELDTPEAAERVLAIAAVGLSKRNFGRNMPPHLVREVGEQALIKFKGKAARAWIVSVAKGEKKPKDRKLYDAWRAASVRALGAFSEPTFRPILEEQLGADSIYARLAAAEGLATLKAKESIGALAQALGQEQNEIVVTALVRALDACLVPPKAEDALPKSAVLAVRAAVTSLGRTSWRADMALVAFLERFRSAETIPALIEILDQFITKPEDVRSGKLSGVLRHRAHDLLTSLTGAFFPIDQPDKWREFWAKERSRLKVAVAKPKTSDKPGTVAGGFFGIPVQGTRVLFILDVSGSMAWPMISGGTTASGSVPDAVKTRLAGAKSELLKAVERISDLASFNVITFSNGVKSWQKDLIPANPRNKKKHTDWVGRLRADGGTNLWGGLSEALKMKSLVYGDRYDTNVDEIFLLSDGAPSVGEVIDPHEILRLVRETNRFSGVRINTVFISAPDPPGTPRQMRPAMPPAELMKRLAEENGGKFVKV